MITGSGIDETVLSETHGSGSARDFHPISFYPGILHAEHHSAWQSYAFLLNKQIHLLLIFQFKRSACIGMGTQIHSSRLKIKYRLTRQEIKKIDIIRFSVIPGVAEMNAL